MPWSLLLLSEKFELLSLEKDGVAAGPFHFFTPLTLVSNKVQVAIEV